MIRRSRQQQLDALLRRCALGDQAKGALEPARSGCRSPLRRRFSGLAEDVDCGRVAGPRREFDVVRTRCDRCSALGERSRGALVRAQPPAARRRLVHGPPNEWMAESEAAWNIGRAHEINGEQLVESVDRLALVRRRSCGRQLGLEGIARDGRALNHEAGAFAEPS